jgi:hypothetical protein
LGDFFPQSMAAGNRCCPISGNWLGTERAFRFACVSEFVSDVTEFMCFGPLLHYFCVRVMFGAAVRVSSTLEVQKVE